jgi:hypothetical protein
MAKRRVRGLSGALLALIGKTASSLSAWGLRGAARVRVTTVGVLPSTTASLSAALSRNQKVAPLCAAHVGLFVCW